MRVKITIIKDNGEEIEISRKMSALDSRNVLSSVERAVEKLQNELAPLLSETMIEEHQSDFVGEKNQEEKRD
jgi:hypothetical protein